MALPEIEQIKTTLGTSKHVLITFPKSFTTDAVASALALSSALRKQGKLVDIVADGFTPTDLLGFLPQVDMIQSHLRNLQKFVITVNADKDSIEEFSYDLDNGKLKIFITPKTKAITAEDITSEASEYKYDLIICLDSPDLDSLGAIHKDATDFFFTTTIINIDHKPTNEQYGQINLTNPNACATAELVYQLINELDPLLLDAQTATCLLTGLIAKTKSFKTVTVSPAALEIASQLLQRGADQPAIIKALYRSRTLATVNLWGRVLARLRSFEGNKLVWSLITQSDFVDSGTNEQDLPDVIEELISFIPGVEIVVIFFQRAGGIGVLLKVLKNHNALYLTQPFHPTGTKEMVRFDTTGKTLVETEQEVIAKIKEQLERTS